MVGAPSIAKAIRFTSPCGRPTGSRACAVKWCSPAYGKPSPERRAHGFESFTSRCKVTTCTLWWKIATRVRCRVDSPGCASGRRVP